MSFDYEALLDTWRKAMTSRDLEGAMRTCHPDIRLALHFGDVPLPFIGVTTGIDACRRRTKQMFDAWVPQFSHFKMLQIQGDDVRAILLLTMKHRWTGFCIDTKVRQHFHFEDGLIRSFDGFMDAPRFNAFMRYVGIAPGKEVSRTFD